MHFLDKYPFLINYFENGIKNPNKNISHSILFYGSDIQAQYDLAIYIARLLNCKKDKNYDCDCLDCNWIRNGEHPAVLTYSRLDNKPDDDSSKTVISVKQAQQIKQSLLISSEFHRVFIFCDRDSNDNILGLNPLNFQEETANALLKTIEEPPERTTFFFLTKSKEDVISTIISRSQCFFVPAFEKESDSWENIKGVFENYFEFDRQDAFNVAENLNNISENSLTTLAQMQNYILSLLKINFANKQISVRLMHDFKSIELAKKQIVANVSPLSAFENLCIDIIK
ncbi:hypothetical protein IJG72_02840 [bacterium]|nr:hypothetical protein [bacterium]